MRGDDQQLQSGIFSYVALEDRIPLDHPLRAIRKLVDQVLAGMSKQFDGLYSAVGRPSIPPERLLRALLLQVFYSIRSERLLMEQLDYNLLFRWFVGLEIDDKVWDAPVYTKNRDRPLNQEVAQSFFGQVKEQAVGLMSDEHFTVDGTLIEAWAVTRVSSVKTKVTATRIAERTFTASSAATIPTPQKPIRMPDCTRSLLGKKPN